MKKIHRTSIIYLCISLATVLLEGIYSSFSHGMSSPAMTYLFAYSLVLGSGVYGAMSLISPNVVGNKYYRLFSNIYNTGIAVLMTGLLLKGIFEIAGTSSGLIKLYFGVSYVLFGIALIILLYILMSRKRTDK